MLIEGIRTEGLGDSTYVIIHDGVAAVVDPQRDIHRFLAIIDLHGVDVRYVLETHLHNDYLSGGRELARLTGAELVLPAGAAPAFRHTPAFHNETLDAGSFHFRPLHTPGHTPEHTSYVAVVDGRDHAVFSGGSLLVRSAGRSDLAGPERADTLARLQYGSVNRLAALGDDVGLMPTHGEGSFCTASGAGKATSTIGEERRLSPVLAYPDEDAFVAGQLSGLGPYPDYYAFMGPMNLAGPEPIPTGIPPLLTLGDAEADHELDGATVIDIRPRTDFAAGHLPDSIGIELSDQVGVWTGWLRPPATPVVIVAAPDQDIEEAVVQLARIGFDEVRGIITDLSPAEDRLVSHDIVTPEDLATRLTGDFDGMVLDVRQPSEVEGGTVPGAVTIHAPDVISDPAVLGPPTDVWVVCGSGLRASMVAGPLAAAGHRPHVISPGGIVGVLARLNT